jgi:hypothetical protein
VTSATRSRFAEVVREEPVDVALACLLIGAESQPDLDVDGALAGLDALAAVARPVVGTHGAAEGLRRALGGFSGSERDYGDLRSSLLHDVLRRRRGLPILLSVVWCEVAARLDELAVPLGLPGHVLVCVGDPLDEHQVVDPFRGGAFVDVAPEPVLHPVDLLLRVLTNIRVLSSRQDRSLESARTRLWATELSLLLPRHPLDLRREQGELLVRLGDYSAGAAALEAFAEAVDGVDAAAADTVRGNARMARSRLN